MIQFLYARKYFEQYRGWAGALGTGLGTALGVKVARPQQVVVCIIGDGAWHYNPVPAALGFAQEYGVPLLTVLCNTGSTGLKPGISGSTTPMAPRSASRTSSAT
jgi:acetolactate synthase-1/2/3 large subunit